MIRKPSQRILNVIGVLLLSGVVVALLAGCGAQTGGGRNVAEQEQMDRRVAELERRLEMQASRHDQLVSEVREGGFTSQAGGRMAITGALDTLLLEEINFPLNKFSLNDYDRETLDLVAKQMAEKPACFLEITGYTDPSGGEFYNYLLSRQRADAAMRYLIDKYDVPLNRMDAQGFGPEGQKYPNDVGEGLNKNRRIEILLRQLIEREEPIP